VADRALSANSLGAHRPVAGYLPDPATQESEALSDVRMVPRRSRKEAFLAGLAAKPQAPVGMTDKTELSPTVGTTVFRLSHWAVPPIWLLEGTHVAPGIRMTNSLSDCRIGIVRSHSNWSSLSSWQIVQKALRRDFRRITVLQPLDLVSRQTKFTQMRMYSPSVLVSQESPIGRPEQPQLPSAKVSRCMWQWLQPRVVGPKGNIALSSASGNIAASRWTTKRSGADFDSATP
jgi:hypothetical protein